MAPQNIDKNAQNNAKTRKNMLGVVIIIIILCLILRIDDKYDDIF